MKFLTALKTALGLAPGCEKVNEFLADYVEGALDEKVLCAVTVTCVLGASLSVANARAVAWWKSS